MKAWMRFQLEGTVEIVAVVSAFFSTAIQISPAGGITPVGESHKPPGQQAVAVDLTPVAQPFW